MVLGVSTQHEQCQSGLGLLGVSGPQTSKVPLSPSLKDTGALQVV